ncbi:MAG: class I SAM-dependent methyltransferase [Candidatus Korobacteraceae bacterium]
MTPFLAQRIWQRKPFSVQLSECGDCGFAFFNPRLEPSEENRLYSGYRGPEYQEMRQSFEPWYTEKFNAGLSSPESFLHRKKLLGALFHERLGLGGRSFENVLDFGGDRGDLIDGLVPATRKFVYEISGVDPVAGVEALRSLEECRQQRFDLIITSNVLEHVGSPRGVIEQVASISGPETLVFNEVPYESVTDLRTRLKRVAQAGWLAVARPGVAWRIAGPGMLTLMHEHVNYYCPRSANRLMEICGFKVLASGVYDLTEGFLGEKMAWILAQKKYHTGSTHS